VNHERRALEKTASEHWGNHFSETTSLQTVSAHLVGYLSPDYRDLPAVRQLVKHLASFTSDTIAYRSPGVSHDLRCNAKADETIAFLALSALTNTH
jgi:hypothetical protein